MRIPIAMPSIRWFTSPMIRCRSASGSFMNSSCEAYCRRMSRRIGRMSIVIRSSPPGSTRPPGEELWKRRRSDARLAAAVTSGCGSWRPAWRRRAGRHGRCGRRRRGGRRSNDVPGGAAGCPPPSPRRPCPRPPRPPPAPRPRVESRSSTLLRSIASWPSVPATASSAAAVAAAFSTRVTVTLCSTARRAASVAAAFDSASSTRCSTCSVSRAVTTCMRCDSSPASSSVSRPAVSRIARALLV